MFITEVVKGEKGMKYEAAAKKLQVRSSTGSKRYSSIYPLLDVAGRQMQGGRYRVYWSLFRVSTLRHYTSVSSVQVD